MSFHDPSAPIEARIDDLIQRLDVPAKCQQLHWDSPAIPEHNIPNYNWWNEALHGVGRNGRATVFPQAIGMAATWQPELIERVADAIAEEARAKHHAAIRRGSRQWYQGLTFWSPNINIFRDPRWGRGQETWGEDPFLTGELGAAFVRGMQGDDPRYLKTAACAKHFAVHSGPEGERHGFDAVPPKIDFWETYLPAFERLVEAGVEAFMPAYNRTYGEPCAGSYLLLRDILRERWGFQGHVVSDCWGVQDFHLHHKVTEHAEGSAALALKAGTDLNCGVTYCEALQGAYVMGLVTEEEIDRALRRLYRTRLKLGMHDPEDQVPYASISMERVNCSEHRALAKEMAAASLVLLKNDRQTLPLREDVSSLLVVGPNAASVEPLLGNYYGLSTQLTTVLEGLVKRVPEGVKMDYRQGVPLNEPKVNPRDWAVFESANVEVTIAAMGISPIMEGEEGEAVLSPALGDRQSIELPPEQSAFLKRIRERLDREKSDARLIVLLFGGGAIACPEVHEVADAVLQVWYPGEAGGDAIAEVLFGDRAPTGRLPITVPRSTEALPPFEDYSMAGRTYRFMDEAAVLYPFGFGLSYSEVSYAGLQCPDQHGAEAPLPLQLSVRNTGTVATREVVQAYVSRPGFVWRLAGFASVALEPGEARTVSLELKPRQWASYDEAGNRSFEPGPLKLHIGAAAPGQRARELGSPEALTAKVTLV